MEKLHNLFHRNQQWTQAVKRGRRREGRRISKRERTEEREIDIYIYIYRERERERERDRR